MSRQRAAIWPAALAVAAGLCLVSPWRSGASSDGIAVFRTAVSLAFEGTFVLPKAPPGATLDPFYFPPSPDGSGVVSIYAPLGALVGAVLLRIASVAPSPVVVGALADGLASLAPIAAMSLAVFPLARLLRQGGALKRSAPWLAAALVLGTFLGPLGVSDFQEPWLVLLVPVALDQALVSRLLRGEKRNTALALAGVALSIAILAKPTAAGLLPVLALPALVPRTGERRGPGILALGLAVVPGAAFALALNASRFGNPFETGYGAALLHPLARAVPPPWTILRLTLLPNRGLLWYAPLLFVLPFVVPELLRGRRKVVVVTAALGFTVFFAANVTWFAWEGGFGWGPRLLAPAVACLAPLLAARGSVLRLAAFLAVAGTVANLPSYLLEPGRLYRFAAARSGTDPLGPVVPIHRRGAGEGELEPLQRAHYVPGLAPVLVGPRLLVEIVLHGDGPEAGAGSAHRSHDAAILRVALRQPSGGGSDTGNLLLAEAWVTAGSDSARARRMTGWAARFGAGPGR